MKDDYTLVHGMKCHQKTEEDVSTWSVWTVVGFDCDMVMISGPGPGRMLKYIPLDEFERDWEAFEKVLVSNDQLDAIYRMVQEPQGASERLKAAMKKHKEKK